VNSLGFTADGKTLVSGLADRVSLWDVDARKLRGTIVSQQKNVSCAAVAPDGKSLATGSKDQTVVLWDTATGKALTTLKGHAGHVRSVSFSPDGRQLLVCASGKTGVQLWGLVP
jgi:WD40 repeat protein